MTGRAWLRPSAGRPRRRPPLTLAQAAEQVAHPLAGLKATRSRIVAYLACQVVGYQHRQDAAASLAMRQIANVVRDYTGGHGGVA